jgi:hypothetical protein
VTGRRRHGHRPRVTARAHRQIRDMTAPARRDWPGQDGTRRDTDGTITHGPSLACGCPLDAGCDGYHPGRLTDTTAERPHRRSST